MGSNWHQIGTNYKPWAMDRPLGIGPFFRSYVRQSPDTRSDSDAVEKLRRGDLECPCKGFENAKSSFAATIFQFRYVRASDSRHLREVSLAPPPLTSQMAESPSEFDTDVICHYLSVALGSKSDVVHEQHQGLRNRQRNPQCQRTYSVYTHRYPEQRHTKRGLPWTI
jgi:hypothetical protein